MSQAVLRILPKEPPPPLMPGHVMQRDYGLVKRRGDGRVHFGLTLRTYTSMVDMRNGFWPIMQQVVTDCGLQDDFNPRLIPERQLESLYVDQCDLSTITRFCRKCWRSTDDDEAIDWLT